MGSVYWVIDTIFSWVCFRYNNKFLTALSKFLANPFYILSPNGNKCNGSTPFKVFNEHLNGRKREKKTGIPFDILEIVLISNRFC